MFCSFIVGSVWLRVPQQLVLYLVVKKVLKTLQLRSNTCSRISLVLKFDKSLTVVLCLKAIPSCIIYSLWHSQRRGSTWLYQTRTPPVCLNTCTRQLWLGCVERFFETMIFRVDTLNKATESGLVNWRVRQAVLLSRHLLLLHCSPVPNFVI